MAQAADTILAIALGLTAGFLVGKTRLSPAIQDCLAAVAGMALAMGTVIVRAVLLIGRATQEKGIAAVGVDVTNLRLLAALAGIGLLCVGVHLMFFLGPVSRWLPYQGMRPGIIGGAAAGLSTWLLVSQRWQVP